MRSRDGGQLYGDDDAIVQPRKGSRLSAAEGAAVQQTAALRGRARRGIANDARRDQGAPGTRGYAPRDLTRLHPVVEQITQVSLSALESRRNKNVFPCDASRRFARLDYITFYDYKLNSLSDIYIYTA